MRVVSNLSAAARRPLEPLSAKAASRRRKTSEIPARFGVSMANGGRNNRHSRAGAAIIWAAEGAAGRRALLIETASKESLRWIEN